MQPPSNGNPVPQFRGDLKVSPKSAPVRGLFDVIDSANGKTVALYDFEISVARLLDGKRQASEVLDAAVRIGIVVTPESLSRFIRQLRTYGFLEDDAEEATQAGRTPGGAWPARARWSAAERQLFQDALKMFRLNRLPESRGLLDELLGLAPANEDARELKARIEEREATGDSVEITFDDLHGGKTAPGVKMPSAPEAEVAASGAGPLEAAKVAPPGLRAKAGASPTAPLRAEQATPPRATNPGNLPRAGARLLPLTPPPASSEPLPEPVFTAVSDLLSGSVDDSEQAADGQAGVPDLGSAPMGLAAAPEPTDPVAAPGTTTPALGRVAPEHELISDLASQEPAGERPETVHFVSDISFGAAREREQLEPRAFVSDLDPAAAAAGGTGAGQPMEAVSDIELGVPPINGVAPGGGLAHPASPISTAVAGPPEALEATRPAPDPTMAVKEVAEPKAPSAPEARPRGRWLAFGAGALVVAVVAAFTVPIPRSVKARCQLRPSAERPVAAERELLIQKVAVSDQQWVEPGTALLVLDTKDAQARVDRLGSELSSLQGQLKSMKATVPKAKVKKAEAALLKADRELDLAEKALAKLQAGPKKPPARKVANAKALVEKRMRVVEKARGAVARLDLKQPLAALTSTIEIKRLEQQAARDEVASSSLPSPTAGLVALTPGTAAGRKAAPGETLATLRDSRTLVAVAQLARADAELVASGQAATVTVEGRDYPGRVTRIAALRLEAEVANPERVLGPDGQGEVLIELPATTPFAWARRRLTAK